MNDTVKGKFNAFAYFFITFLPFIGAVATIYNSFIKSGQLSFSHLPGTFWFLIIFGTICTFCLVPNAWYYFNNSGFGVHFRIGIWPFLYLGKLDRFLPWECVHYIDYSAGPSMINGMLINGFDYYLNFFWITNAKRIKKILYENLPREHASPDAEVHFFQKWERKNKLKNNTK